MSSLETDVLVIGAGPAGSAAARMLAGSRKHVLLVDRRAFPRDKVCGDALIPDALEALAQLGLRKRVLAEARGLRAIRLYAPNGAYVELEAQMACLPRRRLDHLLRTAAEQAGATFLAPWQLASALESDGTVAGAVFVAPGKEERLSVHARCTVLATGAATAPLQIFKVCERRLASAMAARIYVEAPEEFAREQQHLSISYDRDVCPGYGWIFPAPRGAFNVGVGYFNDTRAQPPTANLRHLLDRFVQSFAPAKALMAVARPLTDVRGAPLRTALTGSRLSRPGLLVVGEAAGLTYSFSGEGIGKAIASGIIAAETFARERAGATSADIANAYAARIKAEFAARFRAYRLAQYWLAYPAVLGLLARRANAGTYVRRQLQGLLGETEDPRNLFSLPGLVKSLVL